MAQGDLTQYAPATTEKTITRTIKCRLESSQRKRDVVEQAIDEWQSVAGYMAAMIPSFPPYRWSSRDNQMKQVARDEFDDLTIYLHDRDAAVDKVREAFHGWHERGRKGRDPREAFGEGSYMRLHSSDTNRQEIVENDRGFGMKFKLLKYEDPVWFHLDIGEYQKKHLERITDGDASLGTTELRLEDDELYAHLIINQPVEVYEASDIETWVGVDLGETILYSAVVVTGSGVEDVEMERGQEFRHHRERLTAKRDRAAERGDRRAVKQCKGERDRYTEHITDRASRAIVDLAVKHRPAGIRHEELTGYRQTAEDPIHDWPFGKLIEKITYKAKAEGIPVEAVDPAESSITCRKCGVTNHASRVDRDRFKCVNCEYEVHADVNAAVNIATGGV